MGVLAVAGTVLPQFLLEPVKEIHLQIGDIATYNVPSLNSSLYKELWEKERQMRILFYDGVDWRNI